MSTAPADPLVRGFPLRRKTLPSIARGVAHGLIAPWCDHRSFPVLDYAVAVPARSLFARQLAKYRAYEPVNSNWLISHLRGTSHRLFVDVGANFGWYAMLLARITPQAQVVAIEPAQENFALLNLNLQRNGFSNVLTLQKGAGSQSTRAALYAHEADNPGAHSIRAAGEGISGEGILIEPLDAMLAEHGGSIGLLKIDVEGYEIDALLGARDTLARTQTILLEYSPDFLSDCGHEPSRLLDMLQEAGFRAHLIGTSGLQQVSLDRLRARDPALAGGHRWQVDLAFTRA